MLDSSKKTPLNELYSMQYERMNCYGKAMTPGLDIDSV